MKKLTLILIFFLFIIPKGNDSIMVMSNVNIDNNHYELIFEKDNLNMYNFKLKLGLFTSYDYKITKVYFNYNEKVKDYFKDKEYFSFDSTNFNNGIDKLKDEYNIVLKKNYLYEEMDKSDNQIIIKKIELYTSKDAITKFKSKYPLVTIRNIQ